MLGSNLILILGDSLSASHGFNPSQGWVTLLEKRLNSRHLDYRVINLSISGNTTSNGLDRLPSALTEYQPSIVIIALGSNDGLRGLSTVAMKANLSQMVSLAQEKHAKVLLIGFLIPLNYGPTYRKQFEQVFQDVTKQYQIPKVPFLLEQIALNPTLMQPDGLHPNENAQPLILDTVWTYLYPLFIHTRSKLK